MYRPSSPTSPLGVLTSLGQSVWLDFIHRQMLESGELVRLIERRAVRGVTSNPSIFEQAIGQSEAYDGALAAAANGADAMAIYERLAIDDIRAACDQFKPIHEMSGGNDGFVSLEVSPRLARDTQGTMAEVRRLWKAVARPNVMIKIPGTPEGLPAVTQALSEGINVNITLLFAVSMYERVIDAYITGIEQRLAAGRGVDTVRSVASFFVSRVDTETDKRLEKLVSQGEVTPERAKPLFGTAAVANAKLAYQKYVEHFEAKRFRAVMAKGAAVQRPLWASTSTKNPAFSPVKYVEELIGPDTVNTMPPATLEEFARHGAPTRTIDADLDGARASLAAIEALGVKLSDVTDFLVVDGVKKFADAFDKLLAAVEAKRAKLVPAAR